MKASGVPEKVTMDESGANETATGEINGTGEKPVIIRQVKYLNKIVEQDHLAVTPVTKPRRNFRSLQVNSSRKKCPGRHRTHAHDA